MQHARRDFLSTLALGSLTVAGLAGFDPQPLSAQQAAGHWDLGWVRKLKGRYRTVFDVPDIEDGFGVWRAVIWRQQYSQVFGVPEAQLSTVVVLRSDAVVLGLSQDFWTRFEAGKRWHVNDPSTGKSTAINPVAGRTGSNSLPAQFSGFTLEALIEGGASVLLCALALRDCAVMVARQDNIPIEEADRRVREMLVPGVILQPSGVFAVVLAQDNGCRYVRAS